MLHLSILLKHRILYASKKFTIGVYCLLFYLIVWEEKKRVHTNFTEFTNCSFVARSPMHEESESIYGVSEMSFLLLIPLQRTGKCASIPPITMQINISLSVIRHTCKNPAFF
jgi:hypothetical protein